jgi:hypothetical protein
MDYIATLVRQCSEIALAWSVYKGIWLGRMCVSSYDKAVLIKSQVWTLESPRAAVMWPQIHFRANITVPYTRWKWLKFLPQAELDLHP